MKCARCDALATIAVTIGSNTLHYCGLHGTDAINTAHAFGIAATVAELPPYEAPKVEFLGNLESLISDKMEALKIFRAVLKHAEYVAGNILPGAVLLNEFQQMRDFVDKAEGKPKKVPAVPNMPAVAAHAPGESLVAPGFNHCRHGVPEFIHCAACKAEQAEMKAADDAKPKDPT